MTFPDRDRPEAGTADAMREPGEPYRASTSEGAVPPVARDRVETGGAAHPVAPEGDEPAPRRDVQQDPETTEAADRPPSAAPRWSSATDPEEAPGARWAEATVLTDPAYGVQLIAFRDQGRMLDFLDKTPMVADALFSRSAVAGRAWMIVVKGLYRTRAEAERAVADLPAELKRLDPWIRRFPEGSRFFRLPP